MTPIVAGAVAAIGAAVLGGAGRPAARSRAALPLAVARPGTRWRAPLAAWGASRALVMLLGARPQPGLSGCRSAASTRRCRTPSGCSAAGTPPGTSTWPATATRTTSARSATSTPTSPSSRSCRGSWPRSSWRSAINPFVGALVVSNLAFLGALGALHVAHRRALRRGRGRPRHLDARAAARRRSTPRSPTRRGSRWPARWPPPSPRCAAATAWPGSPPPGRP